MADVNKADFVLPLSQGLHNPVDSITGKSKDFAYIPLDKTVD
jgi:hypothetical protein